MCGIVGVVGHNGNLVNAEELRRELFMDDRRHVNTGSDSEILLNVLAHEIHDASVGRDRLNPELIFNAVAGVHRRVKGAYAVVAMVAGHGMLAFRDPHGIRPLIIGRADTEKGVEFLVASESVTLDTLGFKVMRDVAPGEAILVDESGNFHSRQCAENPELSPCIFEFVYLARPDSVIDGISVYEARRNMGRSLADKIMSLGLRDQIDVVIPIPDSSRSSALEVAAKLKRQYTEGFIKNRYIGRTFIMPGQEMRRKSVRQKLNAMAIEFKDKNVLLVDDSIVRGTTSREIVQMARESGAKKVFFASAAPPVRYPNVYGIDMPSRAELIATGRSEQEIAQLIGADVVIYQDLDALIEDVRSLNPSIKRFDCSCFDGVYVTGDVSQEYLDNVEIRRRDGESSPETRLSSYQLDLGLSRVD